MAATLPASDPVGRCPHPSLRCCPSTKFPQEVGGETSSGADNVLFHKMVLKMYPSHTFISPGLPLSSPTSVPFDPQVSVYSLSVTQPWPRGQLLLLECLLNTTKQQKFPCRKSAWKEECKGLSSTVSASLLHLTFILFFQSLQA